MSNAPGWIPVGWISEPVLAQRLGVPRTWLRSTRAGLVMPEAADWCRAGRSVFWGPLAVQKARQLAKLEVGEPAEPKKPPPIDMPEDLIVLKLVPNPKLLLALQGPKYSLTVRVRVRDSHNFLPKMKIKARRIQGDLYELVGRCPRFRGRW